MTLSKSERRSLSPPIPSYEEATSASNPLLPHAGSSRHSGYYRNPTVESVRSSEDSLTSPRHSIDSSAPTSLASDADSDLSQGLRHDFDDLDDLDYEADGVELDELDDATPRRRRRRRALNHNRWKGRLSQFRKRVGRWGKRWSWRPRWLAAVGIPRLQCPDVPENWRPGASVVARLFGLFVLIGLGYALFMFAILPGARNNISSMFDPEAVRQFAQASVDVDRIRHYLHHVSSYDHIAGSKGSFYLAEWMKDIFWQSGMDDVKMEEYEVYLNYPKPGGRRVAIIDPPELRWEAKIEEDPVYPTGQENTLVFHGHARAGNVSGHLVYANYGSQADYKSLCEDSAVKCDGAIAIVKYYGTQGDRALKVKAAERWGIKGVLIYSDPAEDGFLRGGVWPDGRYRPADGVQRGAVSLMSWIVGDVLTPGWSSTKDAKRISKDNNPGLVNIPSLPLSWRDAQTLLQSLKGHGQSLPAEWHGGVPDVEWWSGDHTSPVVLLQNDQDENDKQRIYNVVGTIDGIETSAKSIVVGNHRDAWCFGAVDP
jgi:N-acetylated-alpha-linked acidic dipeptidase